MEESNRILFFLILVALSFPSLLYPSSTSLPFLPFLFYLLLREENNNNFFLFLFCHFPSIAFLPVLPIFSPAPLPARPARQQCRWVRRADEGGSQVFVTPQGDSLSGPAPARCVFRGVM